MPCGEANHYREKRAMKLSNEKTNTIDRGQNMILLFLKIETCRTFKFNQVCFVCSTAALLSPFSILSALVPSACSFQTNQSAVIQLQGICRRRFTSSICCALLVLWGQLESSLLCSAASYRHRFHCVSYLLPHHIMFITFAVASEYFYACC